MIRGTLEQDRQQRARQIFHERMASLFARLPMLSGFWVREDLAAADVWLDTWPGWDPSVQVAEEVRRVLEDLVDERPETAELLRGRTVARSLQ